MSTSNQPTTQPAAPAKGDVFDKWWGKVIIGAIFLGATYWINTIFTDLETGVTDSVRIHWIIALLYNTLGHIPTVVIMGLIGLVIVVVGLWQFARKGG